MARAGLAIGAGGVAVGDAATGAGIGVARVATSVFYGVGKIGEATGTGIARASLLATAGVFDVFSFGETDASRAIRRADQAVKCGHECAQDAITSVAISKDASLCSGRGLAGDAMVNSQKIMMDLAKDDALYMRMAVGNDTTEAILMAFPLIAEFSQPLDGLKKMNLYNAARAWSWIQDSAGVQMHGLQEIELLQDVERWMRYSAAACGAAMATSFVAKAQKILKKRANANASRVILNQAMDGASADDVVRADIAKPSVTEIDAASLGALQQSDSEERRETILELLEASPDPHSGLKGLAIAGVVDADVLAFAECEEECEEDWEECEEECEKVGFAGADFFEPGAEGVDSGTEAEAIQQRGVKALAKAGIVDADDVIAFEESHQTMPGVTTHVPGYMVVIDHLKGCVVVAFRGSSNIRDALLDLDCKPLGVILNGQEGRAHKAMWESAVALDERLTSTVRDGLNKLGGVPRLLITGHSLGGGVAALLSAIWCDEQNPRFPEAEVRCIVFACPQVLNAELATAMQRHTTSYISDKDCVPCFSWATALELRDALIKLAGRPPVGYDWMWADASIVGHSIARANPLRWSKVNGARETIAELLGYAQSENANRPVILRPNGSDTSNATKFENIHAAASYLQENGESEVPEGVELKRCSCQADQILNQTQDAAALAAIYHSMRQTVGRQSDRLYPSGHLVKLEAGRAPRGVEHPSVDEMIVAPEMIWNHMPDHYLANVIEVSSSGCAVAPLWRTAPPASMVNPQCARAQ